jgi:SpoU rRNA methylase family enzyme
VLSINGTNSKKYIKALFNADSYFKLTEMSESNINYSTLAGHSLIVLNELTYPSSGLASALKLYVENGGSVVVFPDLDANKEVYNQFLTALNLPAVSELIAKPNKVSAIELKSTLFQDVFESLPQK